MAVGVCHTEEIEKSDINFKTEIAVDPPKKKRKLLWHIRVHKRRSNLPT